MQTTAVVHAFRNDSTKFSSS